MDIRDVGEPEDKYDIEARLLHKQLNLKHCINCQFWENDPDDPPCDACLSSGKTKGRDRPLFEKANDKQIENWKQADELPFKRKPIEKKITKKKATKKTVEQNKFKRRPAPKRLL